MGRMGNLAKGESANRRIGGGRKSGLKRAQSKRCRDGRSPSVGSRWLVPRGGLASRDGGVLESPKG